MIFFHRLASWHAMRYLQLTGWLFQELNFVDQMVARAVKKRDPVGTRKRILAAAKAEFARHGLAGARVDIIASRAKINKQLLYHYFGSKEALFTATLEDAWVDIRAAEAGLELEALDPIAALTAHVEFTWKYYLRNPEFLTLVSSENLHKARHIKASQRFRDINRPFVTQMKGLLDRGVAEGVFRPGIDPVQVHITIAAIGYYYLTNRFTGSIVFERDLMAKATLTERLAFNISTILRLVCTPQVLARIEAAA
jgi:AcrR family transcriptional regulator